MVVQAVQHQHLVLRVAQALPFILVVEVAVLVMVQAQP
jgi:hypothetical protein